MTDSAEVTWETLIADVALSENTSIQKMAVNSLNRKGLTTIGDVINYEGKGPLPLPGTHQKKEDYSVTVALDALVNTLGYGLGNRADVYNLQDVENARSDNLGEFPIIAIPEFTRRDIGLLIHAGVTTLGELTPEVICNSSRLGHGMVLYNLNRKLAQGGYGVRLGRGNNEDGTSFFAVERNWTGEWETERWPLPREALPLEPLPSIQPDDATQDTKLADIAYDAPTDDMKRKIRDRLRIIAEAHALHTVRDLAGYKECLRNLKVPEQSDGSRPFEEGAERALRVAFGDTHTISRYGWVYEQEEHERLLEEYPGAIRLGTIETLPPPVYNGLVKGGIVTSLEDLTPRALAKSAYFSPDLQPATLLHRKRRLNEELEWYGISIDIHTDSNTYFVTRSWGGEEKTLQYKGQSGNQTQQRGR